VILSSALADFRIISFVLTESQALTWALSLCFGVATPARLGGKTKVCLQPLSCYGQDRASRPPPLQHRVPIRAASSRFRKRLRKRRSYRITPGPFQSQVRRFLGQRKTPTFIELSHFSLAAPGLTYEPLYALSIADVAQRRFSGLFATPDSFRLNQSPLGAVLLPQAPTPVGHTPLPEGLSLARVR